MATRAQTAFSEPGPLDGTAAYPLHGTAGAATYVAMRYVAATLEAIEQRHGICFRRSKELAENAVCGLELLLASAAEAFGGNEEQLATALDLHQRAFTERCASALPKDKSLEAELDFIVALALERALETCAAVIEHAEQENENKDLRGRRSTAGYRE